MYQVAFTGLQRKLRVVFAVCCYIGHLVLCTAAATSPSVGRHDDAAESDAPLSARPAANVRLAPVSPRTPRIQTSSVLDHELEVLEQEHERTYTRVRDLPHCQLLEKEDPT